MAVDETCCQCQTLWFSGNLDLCVECRKVVPATPPIVLPSIFSAHTSPVGLKWQKGMNPHMASSWCQPCRLLIVITGPWCMQGLKINTRPFHVLFGKTHPWLRRQAIWEKLFASILS